MNRKPILAETFRKYFKYTLRVLLSLEDYHKVVGEPNQLRWAFQAWTNNPFEPDIQYRVQVDVAQ
jgi:hypothetical protein